MIRKYSTFQSRAILCQTFHIYARFVVMWFMFASVAFSALLCANQFIAVKYDIHYSRYVTSTRVNMAIGKLPEDKYTYRHDYR